MALDLATLLVIVALMTRIHSHPEPKGIDDAILTANCKYIRKSSTLLMPFPAQEFFANVQTLSYQILTEPQDASETKLLAQSIASDLKNGEVTCVVKSDNEGLLIDQKTEFILIYKILGFIATIAKLSKIVIVHNISGGFCGLEKNNQYGEALDKLGKL